MGSDLGVADSDATSAEKLRELSWSNRDHAAWSASDGSAHIVQGSEARLKLNDLTLVGTSRRQFPVTPRRADVDYRYPAPVKAVVAYIVGLITRRSRVQIPPPLRRENPGAAWVFCFRVATQATPISGSLMTT